MEEVAAKTNIPSWLNLLLQKYPVLNKVQTDFIIDAYFSIKQNARTENKASEARVREIKKMANNMMDKFKLVVQMLSTNSSSKQLFMKNYPKWEECRDESLYRLRMIADLIEIQKKEFQKSQIACSFFSVIGDLSVWCGNLIGRVLKGLSTSAEAISTYEENNSLEENINQAKMIIQQEQEHLEHLIKCLNEACCLQKAMDGIKSIGHKYSLISTEKFKNVFKKNLSDDQKRKEMQMILKTLNVPEQLGEEISDIVGILITSFVLLERFSPLFRLASKSYQVVSKLRSMNTLITSYFGINFSSELAITNEISNGIFLDVIKLVFFLSQNPNSFEAEEIRKVADHLEEEENQLNNLYKEMMS